MSCQTDYILGTHDDEVMRLGLQHRAWQPAALAAWQSAGIRHGQIVLDIGCGPGYATLDLAELVGPTGRVLAIDKSQKFLNVLDAERRQKKFDHITTHLTDIDNDDFPHVTADAAWSRWVFSFLTKPRQVLARLANSIRPGGVIVMHEYFNYSTWRTAPRCPELEDFVAAVIASWRDAGGEPDIALPLLGWLEDLGFALRSVYPIIDIVQTGHAKWGWMRSFIHVGRPRLVDLGYLTPVQSESIWQAFKAAETRPGTRMITPAVLEIVAVKNDGK